MERILNRLSQMNFRAAIAATITILSFGGLITFIIIMANTNPHILDIFMTILLVTMGVGVIWFLLYIMWNDIFNR